MKKTIILAALAPSALLVGCDHSQDIPAGASVKDPTGVNAAQQQKMADSAKAFGEKMSAQHAGGK